MVCPACGVSNIEGAKFCIECGTSLALTCPSCGTAHPPGQKFCAECGSALGVTASRVAAPAVATPSTPAVPELRFVSVLFVDLVGFTSLSEAREAEDVRELLGRYFTTARTIVERHGGVIEKFIGDAVMAVWGARVAREDDAERAVRAGLEIVDGVTAFGEEVGAPDLRARAGVVTGQVAALDSLDEGIVVGDKVNTASRVQSAATPGTVFVDEVTRQVTAAAIAYEDAGEHAMKGKAEPARLWRAARVLGGVGGRDREELEAPFIGRDSELRLVKELLHATVERRSARLLAITGDAGVGKSRLQRELFNYIDGLADTFLWHVGRSLAHGEGVAYWALSEMVRQRLGIAEEAAPDEVARKLEAGLAEWVPDPADREFIAPRLGALLGVAEPGLGRAELMAGWRLFFERLAGHLPVVLVFEDVQWADEGLLEFVEQLLDWSTSVPIFLVTLGRPELAERRGGWPAGRRGATTLALEPLSDATIRALLDDLVEGLSAAALERIASQAQGIPLYAIETVRALADRGVLIPQDGGRLAASPSASGELGELEVPASLRALLTSRLDALAPDERSLVKAMSVYGGSFPREAARALGALDDERLDAALSALVRKQVLVIRADPLSPQRGQYAFSQGLLRSAAHDLLSRRERKERHLAAAAHLRQTFPNDGEEVAEVIAAHLLDAFGAAGEDPDAEELRRETLAALRRAGQRAATIGAPEAAERAYWTAAGLAEGVEKAEVIEAAGMMALQAGRREAAVALLDEAAGAHEAAGNARAASLLAGAVSRPLAQLGRPGDAVERISRALAALDSGKRYDADVGRLQRALGSIYVFTGEFELAAAALDTALDVAQAFELSEDIGFALFMKGTLAIFLNRTHEARYLLSAATDVAEQHDLPELLGLAQANAGNIGLIYDLPEARQYIDAALANDRRRGDRFGESLNGGNLMSLELYAGRWKEMDELAGELLGLDAERSGVEYVHLHLVALHALRGDAAEATRHLAGLASWRESDDAERSAHYAAHSVLAALAGRRTADALDEGLRALAAEPHLEALRDLWPHVLAAALALGRLDDARQVIASLADRPPGHVPPYLRAHLARGRALLGAAEGAPADPVEADFRASIAGFERLGYPYWLAVARTDLAEWLVDQGRAGEAAEMLDEATTALRPLRAAPALARAEDLLSALPTAAAETTGPTAGS